MTRLLQLIVMASLLVASAGRPVIAGDLVVLRGAKLIQAAFNDGDSFLVTISDPETAAARSVVIRLYYVDCVETRADRDFYKRRLRDQADHFGVNDISGLLKFGDEAANYVRQALSKPFTVSTTFAPVQNNASWPRVYAFVTTEAGTDLGQDLVRRGLARAFGASRRTPSGEVAGDHWKRLGDLEMRAAMERAGIWRLSDAEQLIRLRERARATARELEALGESGPTIDINQASAEELGRLPGIGPILAARIIQRRPFLHVDELLEVRGIGAGTLSQIRGRIMVDPDSNKESR